MIAYQEESADQNTNDGDAYESKSGFVGFFKGFFHKDFFIYLRIVCMNFSLKTKILTSTISLSICGLSIFAYLTFNTYQEDKLAFVYDSLSNEINSKSRLFVNVIDDYEFLLTSLIARVDPNNHQVSESLEHFLSGDQNKVVGLYYYLPDGASKTSVLYEKKSEVNWNFSSIESRQSGISILDQKNNLFVLKKNLGKPEAFAAIVFKQPELLNLLSTKNGRVHFALSDGKVFSKDQTSISSEELKEIRERTGNYPGAGGLFKMSLFDESHFVSFSRPNKDFLLIGVIPEKKVLLVQEVFLRQGLALLLLMASISLLLGTIAARWLTWHLDQLTYAAQEFEKENFDVNVEINSGDELSKLGQAFNHMGGRIKSLLEDLRIYNLELEMKVEDRTKELQNLTDIQKGMLNALGQGFVIVNKDHEIHPVYSKVAESMFEVIPDEATPREIMGISESEGESFKELFQMVYDNVLSLEDMVRLAPDLRSNSKNQKIQLSYAPITSGDSQEFQYIMLVGTDKTQEFENMEKFKKEWNFSQMIYKIASNRDSFNKILGESQKMLVDCFDYFDQAYGLKDIQRLIHTIKGNFSYFNISVVSEKCHDLESHLENYLQVEVCPAEAKVYVSEKLAELDLSITDFIDQYESILQYKRSSKMKVIPVSELKSFGEILNKRGPELFGLFKDSFFRTEVSSYFQMYETITQDLARKLDKKVSFKLEGAGTTMPEGEWDHIFQPFIHFVRNSLDHGIETPDERRNAGKPEEGHIVFSFKSEGDELKVTLKDDGRGVNWRKMAEKDQSIQSQDDAIQRILSGGLSTRDEVSDISGRGVGVSSIFATVMKAGGTMQMDSVEGEGITINLSVPLSTKSERMKLVG